MIPTTQLRWCAACAAETAFERLDCSDHPLDCFELVCTACGAGIEVSPLADAPSPPVEVHEAA